MVDDAALQALAPAGAEPQVVPVHDLDWAELAEAVKVGPIRARTRPIVERMQALFDRPNGPGLLFDAYRENAADRAVKVAESADTSPLWIIGDLHGDLLALEASLALIRRCTLAEGASSPRIVFLGDFIDDEGLALEVLLRVFELVTESPERVCVIAGNHDEALAYDGARFSSSVSPSDFSEFLNQNLADEWTKRAGLLAMRLTAHAARALFFEDGLLISHGGFPLADLHGALRNTGDWNAPECLSDFVWARAHPKARKKLPNRFSRGSQFGYEDFADFCTLSAELGRPIHRFVRGHDHVEERFALYPAYQHHPVLTTVALSRRLPREQFGPFERAPTLARAVHGQLPQVYQLHLPVTLVREVFAQGAPPNEAPTQAGDEAAS